MKPTIYSLVLLALLSVAAPAVAQTTVVPVHVAGYAPPSLADVREAIPNAEPGEEVRAQFEAVDSAPAAVLENDVLVAWVQAAERALELVGIGDARGAVRELQTVGAFSASAVESLNRVATHRETVLNTCLLLVRSLLATDRERDAREQVRECLRLSPNTMPDGDTHPPQVLQLLASVTQEVRTEGSTVLAIRSEGRQGCSVRLNGVLVSNTPAVLDEFPEGEYRVQVECGQTRGRVHRVQLRGQVELVVDPRFEDALVTDEGSGLVLDYQSLQSARRYAPEHAARLARVLGGEVVLAMPGNGGVELVGVRIEDGRALIWRAPLGDGFSLESAREDVTEVQEDEEPAGRSSSTSAEPPPSRSSVSPLNWAIVGGLGAVSIGLGVPALFQKLHEGDRVGCNDAGVCAGFRAFRRPVWLPLGVVSALSLVGAVVVGIVRPVRRPRLDVAVSRGGLQINLAGTF
jgi:hypothetical protein